VRPAAAGSAPAARTGRAVASALREAKLWLRGQDPAANRARLEELGVLDAAPRGVGGLTGPHAAPLEASFDYSHPRYWGAFVVFGAGD
jgi:CHAT domain-containing protein